MENGRMGTATIISLACPLHAMFALVENEEWGQPPLFLCEEWEE